MLIGIDGNEANEVRVGGGGRDGVNQYTFEILWSLYKLLKKYPKKHKVIVFLKNSPTKDFPEENSFWEYKVIPGGKVWVITKLMPYLLKTNEKPDVLFAPSHYLPLLTSIPKVCTIHDLGYLEYSGQFKKYDFWQLKYWSAISIYISKYIIAVSKSTKKDIVRHYSFASKKIKITHHGYDETRFNDRITLSDVRRVKKQYSIVGDYILYLSTLKPSKNLEGLIKAFGLLLKERKIKNLKLVIAGKKGWFYQSIFDIVSRLKMNDHIIFTGYVKEKDKPMLLMGAIMLVSPSFWEGFGMHVLEALGCGTPVVVSKVASLPEVAGGAGVYVDPNSVKSIASGILEVLSMSTKEYNTLKSESIKQAGKFSWEKTAKKTLKVLESVN